MADTLRMQALRNLSNQLPVANAGIAQGQQAAQQMQLQQAVQKAGPKVQTTTTAQDTGAAAAANQGQQMIEGAKNSLQQNQQVGQVGLGEQQRQGQQEVAGAQQGLNQQQMDNVERLANLSEGTKQQLYDANMQFQKDEVGRTLFNEAQLADYAVTKAQNAEQFRNYQQQAEQMNKMKLDLMESAYAKITEDLNQKAAVANQKQDQQVALEIAQKKREADLEMQKARNKAANSAAMWTAGGTAAGAAAGSFGGPAGAMAGGSLGGAAGGAVASQQNQ